MPKPVTRFSFTRATIVAVKPATDRESVYVYSKRTPTPALCVTRSGSRTFYVYRGIHGRPVRVRLGRFPEMTIDQARKQAAVVLAEIARGNDPREQKRAIRRQCTLGSFAPITVRFLALRDPDGVFGMDRFPKKSELHTAFWPC